MMINTNQIQETNLLTETKRWIILFLSCLVTLCIGSLYSWSAFATPLAQHLSSITGKEISNLAIVFTIANAVGPITMISGGYVNDRLGPKRVLFLGSAFFGGGLFLTGFAQNLPLVIITYSLGVGLGVGMIYGISTATAVKCFPDKAGFAGGLVTACYGGSSIIMPIIARTLIDKFGISMAFHLLGIVMFCVIFISAFVIGNYSNEILNNSHDVSNPSNKEYHYKEMIKQPSFYLMLLTLSCGAFAGLMVISQAFQIGQKLMGFSLAKATLVVSILALFNTLGRLGSGTLSDRIGAPATLRLSLLFSIVANVMLYFSNTDLTLIFYIALSMIGISFGRIMGIFPGFTAKQFGRKNNSMNYGIMFIGFALAGLFGPLIMSTIFTSTGTFQPAFLISATLGVMGLILIFTFSKIQGRNLGQLL